MNAIGYIRVSTQEQARKGLSLDAQADRITDYCRAKGLTLLTLVREEGRSAKNITGRPELTALLEAVRSPGTRWEGERIHAIVVCRIDRMFRSAVDGLNTVELFKRRKVAFHSIDDAWDTTTPMGEAMLTIVLAFAQMERRVTSERISVTLRSQKAAKGGSPVSDHRKAMGGTDLGNPPLGLRLEGRKGHKRMVPDENELRVVRRIFELHDAGEGPTAIAQALYRENLNNRKGFPVHPRQVRRCLERAYLREYL